MKIGDGRIINDFIEPNKRQYAIPVYQRNYEWSREQCEKLFEDIIEAYKKDRPHFCGSIVYAPLKEDHNFHYYIIVDGQQRLTTIYLLLKALIDCASTEKEKEFLSESVFNTDKYDEYDIDTASKLKLKPIKSDNLQLSKLMDGKYDEVDKSSGIWINYTIFKELIEKALLDDSSIDCKAIYRGIEKLTCASIRLDPEDNAQEIFERINSTGVPLSVADQIRNYVLMTDTNQEELYETYWLKMEETIGRDEMSSYFLDYLNLKLDDFTREKTAYEDFKDLYVSKNYSNESMLKELLHYAEFYRTFIEWDDNYSKTINECLDSLSQLKNTTSFLFLYRVFDDLKSGIISENTVEKILKLLVSYSVRRIMCEVSSNSLRGFFKSLYNRIFAQKELKTDEHYYNAIVSFMEQTTSRDAIPSDDDFRYALIHNNLYRKNALCKYLLISIENQGKEKINPENLSIEHVMPQNKNLSTAWQKMLGENWVVDRDKWLHTIGNLTLTGYNSELGDKPFKEKKELIEDVQTKVVNLYSDIQKCEIWNAETIEKRGNRLATEVLNLFPIEEPSETISYIDPRYTEYTCEEPKNAKFKKVSYYELLGERVIVDGFAPMLKSVAKKLYDLDSSVIEKMARSNEKLYESSFAAFSYDENKVKKNKKIQGTDIFISTGYSAPDIILFIKALLQKYGLNVNEDFIYCARTTLKEEENDEHI